MDVFGLRDRVVGEYRDYVESFVNILDEGIAHFVHRRLDEGELWPDAVLQLNPAYLPGPTLGDLADAGTITPETARFFGRDLRLHRHQQEALETALRDQSYVVSTGTGSGKSLTYLVPIIDHVFRHEPERHSVRAIIVYPMNALINSQLEALERYRKENWPDCPVEIKRYTGQERKAEHNAVIAHPPHILLTNYVMLEYMLIRPDERPLVQQATRELRFLVMDELHVYRGRQGADVAMLLRRVRQRAGNRDLLFVGTSATLATSGNRDQRREAIARVGASLFGVPMVRENVIDESLRRVMTASTPRAASELRAAVELDPPAPALEAVAAHPLAAWVEETFGLDEEDGRLVRRAPLTVAEGLKRLVEATGLDETLCRERLAAVLDAGNRARTRAGAPVFAFRLHQFLSSGSSVYATIESPEARYLTTEGQQVAPGTPHPPLAQPSPARGKDSVLPSPAHGRGGGGEGGPAHGRGVSEGHHLLYPLAFCRECGQEYYMVSLVDGLAGRGLIPRSPLLNAPDDDTAGALGFFSPERDGLWAEDEELPESWSDLSKASMPIKEGYKAHVPVRCWVRPDGALSHDEAPGAVEGWLQPRPLMLCLRCRVSYDLRANDFGKLATLSQTGRSTATTITTSAAVVRMREDPSIDRTARKVLSFTDNRQDASLQAGHMNDFVQVALLRGALVRALAARSALGFDGIGQSLFDALALEPDAFMKEVVESGPGLAKARATMVDLLEYRAFEDLRRAWRVAQPNLEQCGLLRVGYEGLDTLAADAAVWRDSAVLSSATVGRRTAVLHAVLDNLRGALAIDAHCLALESTKSLTTRANQWLREPWSIDRFERLRRGAIALLPGVSAVYNEEAATVGLGYRSAIGRYLRSRHTWDRPDNLGADETDETLRIIVAALRGHILMVAQRQGEDYGVQLMAGALRWEPGDGTAAGPDPVRARSLHLRRREVLRNRPNHYFQGLYRERAPVLSGVAAREHTGQVSVDDRIQREEDFRHGRLAALFCSPTMELGVDIADLNVVHMRNVPPTPANYAQRSGRAGRGGRPALVLAFCSQGNGHDQYFLRRKGQMIAGAVAPARLDLANRELVEAHLHSVWLAEVGLGLGVSVADLLDLDEPGLPLLPEPRAQIELSEARQREVAEAFRQVMSNLGDAGYNAAWLAERVREAPRAFDAALGRWRELYRAAIEQRDAARRVIDKHKIGKDDKATAEQREREAKRELDLLLNQGDTTEADFYPYRYLANEGFLPGYNFPRLPLRALVTVGERARALDRPRFLGLGEYGPHNVIYHEGRKHRVTSCVLPAGGFESRLSKARICLACGYIHPGDAAFVDLCQHCATRLDADSSQFPQALFDQPSVRVSPQARISSDEEDRSREGYHITTHYRFAPRTPVRRAHVVTDEKKLLLEARYAPQAELWRINHGWRRVAQRNGFTIDTKTGRWQARDNEEIDPNEANPAMQAARGGIKPYVTDSRNILLLRPYPETEATEDFSTSLVYALQRGIQTVFQVEEQEVAVELIGRDDNQRLLLWEAAEGGTGVWDRLLDDRHAFADVAREALRICHFDPKTGLPDPAWTERCGVACYDCLLSYANQGDHRRLSRHLVRDYLMRLARSEALPLGDERDYDARYRWLAERLDPASTFETRVLDYLHDHRLRLPDQAQYVPEPDVPSQPDFYYERDGRPGSIVYVDGPHHAQGHVAARDRTVRESLADRGYRVVEITHDRPIEEQIATYSDVFGEE